MTSRKMRWKVSGSSRNMHVGKKALPLSKGAATGILFKNREVKVRPATRAGKGVDLG